MDLADFLRAEVGRTSYRDVEEKTLVSRGAIENIIKRTNKDLPTIETLSRIAIAYNRPLWEVVQMVVDLELPQSPTDLGQRLAALVERHPKLGVQFARLQALALKRPDILPGIIEAVVTVIEGLDQDHNPPPVDPIPPNPPGE